MALWDGLLNWLGYGSDEESLKVGEQQKRLDIRPVSNNKGKLVGLPTARNATRLIITRPQSFEEVSALAESLKNYCPLIVNLEDIEVNEARRIIDFLSGAVFVLGGRVRRITGGIFLFATSNIDLGADQGEQIFSSVDYLEAAGRN